MNSRAYGIAPPAGSLPADTRPGTVRLQVAELHRSLAYYTGVLGLRHLAAAPGTATLGAGDEPLVELVERAGAQPVPRRGRLGLYHFALLLPDRPSLGRFLAHLAALGVAAGSADHAVSEALYLTDPDGLGIEVYADRPRDRWRVAGRELAMTTEPLDLADLHRAAGGESWSGMPPGTSVGHVHLFVGSLEQAEAFYHAALGFDKVVWSYPGALFFSAGGYHHHLGTNTWAAGAAPADEGDARLLQWQLVVPDTTDAEAAAQRLRAAGYRPDGDGADRLVTDPWGTTLRIHVSDATTTTK
jgi:catechol 2,3-dioxygenase